MANKKTTKTKKSTSTSKSASKSTKSVKKVKEFKLFDKSTYWCVGFVVAVIAIVACVCALYNSFESYTRPNYSESAIIYHSESIAADAGTEYIYSIYKKKDSNEYFYIKSKSQITMVGSGESKDIESGSLKNKDSFIRITNDIEKDAKKDDAGTTKRVTYTLVKDGVKTEVSSIEELANKLFA